MRPRTIRFPLLHALAAALAAGTGTAAFAAGDSASLVEDALKAAPPSLRESVTVKDWEGNTLREGDGSSAYVCFPTPSQLQGTAPMCMDEVWMKWGEAWQGRQPFQTDRVGISYMMAGDEGASNTDPYAEGRTADNQWVVEGPHLMLILPDAAMLDTLPTDPTQGGPYVMWKGTPYAHVMVPVGERPDQTAAAQ